VGKSFGQKKGGTGRESANLCKKKKRNKKLKKLAGETKERLGKSRGRHVEKRRVGTKGS